MNEVGAQAIRQSFINCSRGEARRLALPSDLGARPWADLDFLGWRDPTRPGRSALVTTTTDDRLVGVMFRVADTRARRRAMCGVCLTTHPGDGVALMTARKVGVAGRRGDSVGLYLCADLDCSLYLRGRKDAGPGARMTESLTLDEQIGRCRATLLAFLDKLFG
ncbi:FBP domain-containing protein [Micromonospora sp. WMMD882]|uniref:FBP domain-containing protein n=1 Tax=Micromonospora sp. WMMD882 TaxID=3015151 RepID=UPI00248B1BC7|nr:FBP domain-containing protein [Micromonospora sp. WMMD882]WBB81914.1 FBP domain-containing protein [Micromonospora sp. WMMD882]